jgi:hypothetical protein
MHPNSKYDPSEKPPTHAPPEPGYGSAWSDYFTWTDFAIACFAQDKGFSEQDTADFLKLLRDPRLTLTPSPPKKKERDLRVDALTIIDANDMKERMDALRKATVVPVSFVPAARRTVTDSDF